MVTKNLAQINNVQIQLVENGNSRLVPIKPICEALGIDYESQRQKLKSDEFLNSVTLLSTATGADGKNYEMTCLPFEFVFGWLFTINPKNVKEEAREAVVKYRAECYRALYEYFTEPTTYLKEKQVLIDQYQMELDTAKANLREAKKIVSEKQKAFDQIHKFTLDQWRANNRQYILPFAD